MNKSTFFIILIFLIHACESARFGGARFAARQAAKRREAAKKEEQAKNQKKNYRALSLESNTSTNPQLLNALNKNVGLQLNAIAKQKAQEKDQIESKNLENIRI